MHEGWATMSARAEAWPRASGGEEQRLASEGVEERDEAFAALVARRSRLMFRVAYALLRNAHDAEDAVQEAFLKLYRGEAWRRMEDEQAFLARTVWRVAFDRLPTGMSARGRPVNDVAEMDLPAAGRSPEETVVGGDERALLRQLIQTLPEELRQALLLSAVEEMTSREVAVVMSIPEGTVRTRVMRAKAELKRRFEAMGGVKR